MGETTVHFEGRVSATEVLKRYFSKGGRSVFIASDLHTLYPGEKAFYPDLLVVFDVKDHHRRSWNVLREKKGLDFVLEILSRDSKRKDKVDKMNLYARLGIPEYFFYDPETFELKGFQLVEGTYREIKNKEIGVYSGMLGLYLSLDNLKIRFSTPHGVEILFTDELIHNLNRKISEKDDLIKFYSGQAESAEEELRTVKEQAQKDIEEERRDKEEERKEKERMIALLKQHGIDIH